MAIKGNIPDIGKAYIMEIGKRLEKETDERKSADDSLKKAIEEEAKARKEADDSLQKAIDTETKARKEEDENIREEFRRALEEFGNSVIADIVIPKAAWTKEGGKYAARVSAAAAKADRLPITVIWEASFDIVKRADMSSVSETKDGEIVFRAKNVPEADIYTTVAFLYPKEVLDGI